MAFKDRFCSNCGHLNGSNFCVLHIKIYKLVKTFQVPLFHVVETFSFVLVYTIWKMFQMKKVTDLIGIQILSYKKIPV